MATDPSGESKTQPARVIYDFEGNAKENQLSISAGQLITLIGDVTAENWIFAKTKDNVEGWIPDGYFEVLQQLKQPRSSKLPPPAPIGIDDDDIETGGGYKFQKVPNDSFIHDTNDTFGLFVYQYEWFAIVCVFLGALITFMFSTPQPDAWKWRMSISSWLSFVMSAVLSYVCGINRYKFKIRESTAIVRAILFCIAGILLIIGYPTGIPSGVICIFGVFTEIRLHLLKIKPLPSRITDEWCSTMFGGTDNCPPMKLIIFFIVLALDFGIFGWGYVDGYNIAFDINLDGDYHLNTTSNAFMFGFGRIITINLCFILLLACKLCTSWIFNFCKTKIIRNKKVNSNLVDDVNIRLFLHRCMGYSIVCSSFLHIICAYFTFEDSGSQRSFTYIYGDETFITGIFILLGLAYVVASGNDTLSKQNTRLFNQTHRISLLVIILLIVHGSGFISTYYYQLIIVPIVFFACDIFFRYLNSAK